MWVHNESKEILPEVCRLLDLGFQCFLLTNLLVDKPLSLILSNVGAAQLLLLFDLVEIVHNNSHEKIKNELTSKNHEDDFSYKLRPHQIMVCG